VKKFLLVLIVAAGFFGGCKKDTGANVNIGTADIAAINNQLKGIWVFPVNNQKVVDSLGRTIVGSQFVASPALQFNGVSTVTIYQDTKTKSTGTYSLSTSNGLIYLDITYADGSDVTYQVLVVNSTTLKLLSAPQPYVYNGNLTPEQAMATSNITLQKQNSANVTGSLIRVVVKSDSSSAYSFQIAVTHTKAPAPADTTSLLVSKTNVTGTFTYEFPAKSGDQLLIDIAGDNTKTFFYAYYNGIPMQGNIGYLFQEIKTTTGWTVQ
jgi:hypothetical protein